MNNPKVDELLKVLTDKGVDSEEVTRIRDELLEQAYGVFMNEALQSLSDEDLQKIEAAGTQEEANAALRSIYKEKTGKDAEEEMRVILNQKAQELIDKHLSSAATPVVGNSPSSDAAEITKATDELHKIAGETHDPVKAADPANWQ